MQCALCSHIAVIWLRYITVMHLYICYRKSEICMLPAWILNTLLHFTTLKISRHIICITSYIVTRGNTKFRFRSLLKNNEARMMNCNSQHIFIWHFIYRGIENMPKIKFNETLMMCAWQINKQLHVPCPVRVSNWLIKIFIIISKCSTLFLACGRRAE